jgi:hypothetical protein
MRATIAGVLYTGSPPLPHAWALKASVTRLIFSPVMPDCRQSFKFIIRKDIIMLRKDKAALQEAHTPEQGTGVRLITQGRGKTRIIARRGAVLTA